MKKYICKVSFDIAIGGPTFTEKATLGSQGIQLGLAKKVDKAKFDMHTLKFGMWGNSNDANKYYPNATADSIMPKPEDFVSVPFRMLSATIVGAGTWKATDFSDVSVLKASVPMLNNLAIFPQHDPEIYNWIGYVSDPVWEDQKTIVNDQGKSILVPGGINGNFMIDAKTNPNIARGALLGTVYSNSVTVAFECEPSHQFENEGLFLEAIGTMLDGRMVTRRVTKILDYFETSLVWLGADPFAKKLDSKGNPIKIDSTSVQYYSKANKAEKKVYSKEKAYRVNNTIDSNVIYLSKESSKFNDNSKNKQNMNKFLLAFLAAFGSKLSLSIDGSADLSEQQENELITSLGKLQLATAPDTEAENAKKLVQRLKAVTPEGKLVDLTLSEATENYALVPQAEVEALYKARNENEQLKETASLGTEFLNLKRTEAIRQYNIATNGKKDEAVIALFNKATSKELDGLLAQYGKTVTAKFEPTCTKCNSSEHITMRTSYSSAEEPKNEEPVVRPASTEELREKYGASKMVIGK